MRARRTRTDGHDALADAEEYLRVEGTSMGVHPDSQSALWTMRPLPLHGRNDAREDAGL